MTEVVQNLRPIVSPSEGTSGGTSRSRFRVCVSNLNYYTTEEELEELLTEFNVVLIPSYTVHFSRTKFKPLGIAYAEFSSLNDSNKAIEQFNGFSYKGRPLRVRYHVPVKPRYRASDGSTGGNSTAENSQSVDANGESAATGASASTQEVTARPDESAPTNSASPMPTAAMSTSSKNEKGSEIKYSSNTLFLSNVHQRASPEDIQEFFSEDKPAHIHKWKQNRPKRGSISFRHRSASYFVVFDTNDELDALEKLVEKYRNKKLRNRSVFLQKAIKEKAEGVINQIEEAESTSKEEKQVSSEKAATEGQTSEIPENEVNQAANEATTEDSVTGGDDGGNDVVTEIKDEQTNPKSDPEIEGVENQSSGTDSATKDHKE